MMCVGVLVSLVACSSDTNMNGATDGSKDEINREDNYDPSDDGILDDDMTDDGMLDDDVTNDELGGGVREDGVVDDMVDDAGDMIDDVVDDAEGMADDAMDHVDEDFEKNTDDLNN